MWGAQEWGWSCFLPATAVLLSLPWQCTPLTLVLELFPISALGYFFLRTLQFPLLSGRDKSPCKSSTFTGQEAKSAQRHLGEKKNSLETPPAWGSCSFPHRAQSEGINQANRAAATSEDKDWERGFKNQMEWWNGMVEWNGGMPTVLLWAMTAGLYWVQGVHGRADVHTQAVLTPKA